MGELTAIARPVHEAVITIEPRISRRSARAVGPMGGAHIAVRMAARESVLESGPDADVLSGRRV